MADISDITGRWYGTQKAPHPPGRAPAGISEAQVMLFVEAEWNGVPEDLAAKFARDPNGRAQLRDHLARTKKK